MDDNWGEFEVRYEDPERSLMDIEAKVIELEKVQEGVVEEGRKARELVDKCTVNTKLRLEAMEKQQQTLERLGTGLLAAAGILAIFQLSSLIFSMKGWFVRRHQAEEISQAEERGSDWPTSVRAQNERRPRHNRRSHARQWRADGHG